MRVYYFVEYNGEFVAYYKTLNGARNFVSRKGYTNDLDNVCRIFDTLGNEYRIY